MRSDAARNRGRILGAARELVAAAGVDATMEDIARRAGVAVGTLYRHFPAKEDLIAAVVEDSIEHIAGLSERALAAVDGGAGAGKQLGALFAAVVERHATDRALKAAAGMLENPPAADLASAPPGSATARAVTAITALLERARSVGAVRADLTLADLVMLLGAAPADEAPPEMRRRYVEIVLTGLSGGESS
ncbi:MAG TPA: helix-turn-helix domain-containing protein [Pseudonocardiaceae bacterium]